MGKISLNNIAEELAAKSGITRDAADSFMHAFIATIEKGLHEDNMVKIKGLGTFKLMAVSDRSSVDVNTGERITIKGHTKVSFTPDSAMKEFVNRPFAHFEPTELNDGYPTEEDELQEDVVSEENDDVEILEPTMEEVVPLTNEDLELPEPAVPVEEPAKEVVVEEADSESIVTSVEDEPSAPSTPDEQENALLEEVATEESVPEEVAPDRNTIEIVPPEETTSEKEVATENIVPEQLSAPTSEEETVSPREGKKRRGCGCILAILLILSVLGAALYWLAPIIVTAKQSNEEDAEEHNTIVVKPNLEEELGAEWGDEPKVETELPVIKEDKADTVVVPDAKIENIARESSESIATESSKPKTTPVSPDIKFCAVTITESLEAKAIQDITPADTTDYLMEGTLVTHELKRGETIILLAKKYYGDKRLWPYIVKYNWMKDFNHVAIGQMINIPILKDRPSE